MWKQLFIIILGTLALETFSQSAEVSWSQDFRVERKQKSVALVGVIDDNFLTLREISGRSPEFVLEIFDRKSLELKTTSKLELPKLDDGDVNLDRVMIFGGKTLMITTSRDRRDDRLSAYGTWLNARGQPEDIPILLGEIAGGKRMRTESFGFELSPDSSMLLVYNEDALDRRANSRFSFKVYDANLDAVWQKDIELPYRAELLEIDQFLIDNRGHLYMMSGVKADKRAKQLDELRLSEKRYILISYDPDQNKVKEFEVNLKDKWVIATTFDLTRDGDLVIGGFYSNDRLFTIAGTFFFRVDGDSKLAEASGLKAFSKEFLAEFMSERRAERGQELDNFYFDHFILRDDGSATMIAEQYYMIQRFRTDMTTGRQEVQNYYHFNDIIVVDITPDGQINWTVKIPKEQITLNDRGPYSSYALTADNDSLYILFNDDPENTEFLAKNPDASPKTFNSLRRSVVVKVAIDRNGAIHREELFRSLKDDTVLKPRVHISLASGELFIYAQLRKQYRFGRIRF